MNPIDRVNILYVGGLGNNDSKKNYFCDWEKGVKGQLKTQNLILTKDRSHPLENISSYYFRYDDVFEHTNHRNSTYLKALLTILDNFPNLAETGLELYPGVQIPLNAYRALPAADIANSIIQDARAHTIDGILDMFPDTGQPLVNLWSELRWSFGMIAQLFEEPALREALSEAFDEITAKCQEWDIIIAHSLGSLITYYVLMYSGHNLVTEKQQHVIERRARILGRLTNCSYVTLGCQIGYSVVIDELWKRNGIYRSNQAGNYIGLEVPPLERWYNLFNRKDPLTVPLAGLIDPELIRFKSFIEVDVSDDNVSGHAPITPHSQCQEYREKMKSWRGGAGYLNHSKTNELVWKDIVGRKLGIAFGGSE